MGVPTRPEYFESPWQNRANPVDVNSDRFVTPLDALLVINWLNAHGASSLNEPDQTASIRIDVSGDGLVTPLDALRVLNHLNARLSGDGEGGNERASAVFDLGGFGCAVANGDQSFRKRTVPDAMS